MSKRYYRMMAVLAGVLIAFFSVTACKENNSAGNDDQVDDSDHPVPEYATPADWDEDDNDSDDPENGDCCGTDEDEVLPEEEVFCPLEDSFLAPMEGVDTYFAFRAIGVINDAASTARPTAASPYKIVVALPEHPDFKLAQPLVYFQRETNNGQELASLMVLGDPGSKYYTSVAWVALPVDFLVSNKEALTLNPDVSGAPTAQMITLDEIDANTLKQCTIAINDIAEDDTAPGKMRLCVADNVDFAVDETMKVAINAPLTEDGSKLLELFGETDPAKLCVCFDVNSSAEVPCPGTETPDDDTLLSDSENADDLLPDDE